MSHIKGFRIRIDPGWKKTKRELSRFCRAKGLPKVRYAMTLDDASEELANCEQLTEVLRESDVPENVKIRFNWLIWYISSQIQQLLDLNPLSLDEFVGEAKEAGFNFKGSRMIR